MDSALSSALLKDSSFHYPSPHQTPELYRELPLYVKSLLNELCPATSALPVLQSQHLPW